MYNSHMNWYEIKKAFGLNTVLVYCSKIKEDWEKALALLKEAGIDNVSWVAQDTPVVGMGAKLDPRSFWGYKKVSMNIYKIEVEQIDARHAKNILKDQVRDVEHHGYH